MAPDPYEKKKKKSGSSTITDLVNPDLSWVHCDTLSEGDDVGSPVQIFLSKIKK